MQVHLGKNISGFVHTGIQDFTPEVVQLPDFTKAGRFEDFNNLVTRVAHWIPANQVRPHAKSTELLFEILLLQKSKIGPNVLRNLRFLFEQIKGKKWNTNQLRHKSKKYLNPYIYNCSKRSHFTVASQSQD